MYQLYRPSKTYIQNHYKVLAFIALTLTFTGAALLSHTTFASTGDTRLDAWGTLEVAGNDALNMGGNGVDVYSNGSTAFYTPNKPNNCVMVGQTCVTSGEKWQCVEFVNRLYLTKGWISSNWAGNGGDLYANRANVGLSGDANGSIANLQVGDEVSYHVTTIAEGHTAIVSAINGSTITMINQNTKPVYNSGTLSNGSLTIGWQGYTVAGVVHAPTTGGGGGGSPWAGVGAAEFHGDTLVNGATLYRNQYLVSLNVQYALVFQSDSNLVLYKNGQVLWTAPGSLGSGADHLVMQGDGNLVLYRPNRTAVWNSVTGTHAGAYFNVQSDGNIVVRTAGAAYWASGTGGNPNFIVVGNYLANGQQVNTNEYIHSPDGRYALLMQTDGNAVLYDPGAHPLWSTGNAEGGNRLVMQADGNLVKYAGAVATWASSTSGTNNPTTNLQSDGNLVIRIGGTSGTAVWTRANWVAGQI